jgi:hypothetical protein
MKSFGLSDFSQKGYLTPTPYCRFRQICHELCSKSYNAISSARSQIIISNEDQQQHLSIHSAKQRPIRSRFHSSIANEENTDNSSVCRVASSRTITERCHFHIITATISFSKEQASTTCIFSAKQ